MLKRRQLLSKTDGMTLIELNISILIGMIVGIGIMQITLMVSKTVSRSTANNDFNMLLAEISSRLTTRIVPSTYPNSICYATLKGPGFPDGSISNSHFSMTSFQDFLKPGSLFTATGRTYGSLTIQTIDFYPTSYSPGTGTQVSTVYGYIQIQATKTVITSDETALALLGNIPLSIQHTTGGNLVECGRINNNVTLPQPLPSCGPGYFTYQVPILDVAGINKDGYTWACSPVPSPTDLPTGSPSSSSLPSGSPSSSSLPSGSPSSSSLPSGFPSSSSLPTGAPTSSSVPTGFPSGSASPSSSPSGSPIPTPTLSLKSYPMPQPNGKPIQLKPDSHLTIEAASIQKNGMKPC